MTCGGSDAEDERMKRRLAARALSALRPSRARMVWCMVGTAVYQVGFTSSSQAKKRSALKPGVQLTDAPEASDDRTAAIRPWMWNSGMMLRQRSLGFSASAPPMWRAEAARLAADRGTILGRAVVPDVCSTRAVSIPRDGPVLLALAGGNAE